ncbi:MAG: ABC transporter substrate-binding protein [Thermoproteota archaeon]
MKITDRFVKITQNSMVILIVLLLVFSTFYSTVPLKVAAQEEKYLTLWAGWKDIPPVAHFNPWATGLLGWSYSWITEPLAIYLEWNDTYIPWLATSWEWNPTTKEFTVHLRRNVMFHDGHILTSKDVLTTLYANPIGWYPYPGAPTREILNITAPDDYTVVWKYNYTTATTFKPGPLTTMIYSHKVFGKWVDPIIEACWNGSSKEVINMLVEKLRTECRPEKPIGTSAVYWVHVTETEWLMKKFTQYWRGNTFKWDGVRVLNTGGLAEMERKYVIEDQLVGWTWHLPAEDYTWIIQEASKPGSQWKVIFVRQNMGQSIWNCKKYPLSIKEFRQALYTAINTSNHLGPYFPASRSVEPLWFGKPNEMARRALFLPLPLARSLVGDEFINKLKTYDYDIEKAKKMLDDLNFIDRDGDGIRETPNGTKLEFTIVTTEFWAPITVYVTQQMERIGVKLNVQFMATWSILWERLYRTHDWDWFQLFYFGWPTTDPYYYFSQLLVDKTETDIYYPNTDIAIPSWVDPSAPTINNMRQYVIDYGKETDPAKKTQMVKNILWYLNEYLPMYPYSVDGRLFVINTKLIAGNIPPEGDPLWSGWPYSDIYILAWWAYMGLIYPPEEKPVTYVIVWAKAPIETFTGVDGKIYGPFPEGSMVYVPDEDARRLVSEGLASFSAPAAELPAEALNRISSYIDTLSGKVDTLSSAINTISFTLYAAIAIQVIVLVIVILVLLRVRPKTG